MRKIFIALLGLSLSGFAQQQKYTVVAKDNLYNIAKKHGVSLEDLIKNNPKIKDGKLNIGDVLLIPSKGKSTVKKVEKNIEKPVKLGKIYLQPKQTIYSITKTYKISEAELRKLNPDLDNHMKIGDAITLPEDSIKKYGDKSAQMPSISKEVKRENVKAAVQQSEEIYTIQPKDTYYGITRKFNISQKELFVLNPDLEEKGLQPGDVIKLKGAPMAKKQERKEETKTVTHSVEEYVIHKVQKGDTAFGIINKYNISYEQLSQLNNGLSNGIQEGMELKVKKYERQYLKVEDDVFQIALILPFGFDSNDNKYRGLATDFLVGAKLAAERNAKKGQKINLNIIDAENENTFKNNMAQINKENTDVIIGPLFKSNVLEVLNYVKDEKTPVVAPFANDEDLYSYSNLILVEPNNRVYTERIIKEVKAVYANQKVYIVGDKNESEVNFLKDQLKRELAKSNVTIVASPTEIELEQSMMTGQKAPAIVILAENNDRVGRTFAQKLIELGKQTEGVKAFSMYYHADFEKNIDALSKTNLVYLMDRKINTNGSFEKDVLADFKAKYCRVPSKYMIIGFDVMNDILAREKKGDIMKQMDKTQTHLATKFEYVRMKKNGALVNTGYRVVRLVP